MAGQHTQAETKRQNPSLDLLALAALSNLQISALSARNQIERTVLDAHGLTWSGFVTLWVVWAWNKPEARQLAAETGLAKATLSGVLNTLESSKLIVRKQSKDDKRIILVGLTTKGQKVIEKVFPEVNRAAKEITTHVGKENIRDLANFLAALS
jgi:MarR family transcriptional regulator, organic hydroperoxide resistance regulator